jgi:microcystin degradation protein MlrC
MAVIAVGGLQHETNTFAPTLADYAAFEDGGGWPPLSTGPELFDRVAGANIPIQGAIEHLRSNGHRLVPLLWAAASPSAHVTNEAFERLAGDMINLLSQGPAVDGVVLDLHGAMVTQAHDDGEGELLRRVREAVGPRVPIVISLDLHANITQSMVQLADAISVYRTYPHVDMAATGGRAAMLLDTILRTGQRLPKYFHQFDYLTGIASQCTLTEPCATIYAALELAERQHGLALSFATGFPMADIEQCGMSLLGYALPGSDHAALQRAAHGLRTIIEGAEAQFAQTLYSPAQAVALAKELGRPGAPVVMADTQDNPGAGGNGDTTELLQALLDQHAHKAVLGLLIDPAAALKAHQAGLGAALEFSLGAHSGLAGHKPVNNRFTVAALGDGRFTCTGPMFNGFRMQLGLMARLSCNGVDVVVASSKCQAADQAMFRHVGVEPAQQAMLALKSSVHFRNDFQTMARQVLVVKAPGPALADPSEFAWTKLRKGVRLKPLGRPFEPALG